MITTLDEAIAHSKEKAEELKQQAMCWKRLSEEKGLALPSDYVPCLECAKDHEQLVEWLTELKAISILYDEYKNFGGAFHYQVGRVLDGDYVLPSKESEAENETN